MYICISVNYVFYTSNNDKFLRLIKMLVLINSIGKISDGWIRDLGFNLRLYQKPIDVLI